jgi:hypothetical protein
MHTVMSRSSDATGPLAVRRSLPGIPTRQFTFSLQVGDHVTTARQAILFSDTTIALYFTFTLHYNLSLIQGNQLMMTCTTRIPYTYKMPGYSLCKVKNIRAVLSCITRKLFRVT